MLEADKILMLSFKRKDVEDNALQDDKEMANSETAYFISLQEWVF